jgi:hypothetical protein
MSTLSARTQAKMRQTGWYPGRQVDTTAYEAALQAEGYPVHPIVVEFLREFGGLSLVVAQEDPSRSYNRFHFDAARAAERIYVEAVESDYNIRIGAHLCAIGEAYQNHMTLLMDDTGRVYGGYDDTMAYFGESGEAAIEALCWGLGQPMPQGPIPWEDP